MEQQHFYPFSEFHLFEQIVSGLEDTMEENYPIFEEVSQRPHVLDIHDVLRAVRMFNEHYEIEELNANQFRYWREKGVTDKQEKMIADLEKCIATAMVTNKKILSFLNA